MRFLIYENHVGMEMNNRYVKPTKFVLNNNNNKLSDSELLLVRYE